MKHLVSQLVVDNTETLTIHHPLPIMLTHTRNKRTTDYLAMLRASIINDLTVVQVQHMETLTVSQTMSVAQLPIAI